MCLDPLGKVSLTTTELGTVPEASSVDLSKDVAHGFKIWALVRGDSGELEDMLYQDNLGPQHDQLHTLP